MHRLLRHASGLQLLRQKVCQAAAGCGETPTMPIIRV